MKWGREIENRSPAGEVARHTVETEDRQNASDGGGEEMKANEE